MAKVILGTVLNRSEQFWGHFEAEQNDVKKYLGKINIELYTSLTDKYLVQNGSERFRTVRNGSERFGTVQNGSERFSA